MKKSTVFKILTLFLTFVIFSCCSGCIIFALAKKSKQKEKDIQHWIEIQKERKAQADALIPEIDGYVFEALPKDAFKDQADWESKGFLTHREFFNWNKGPFCYYIYEKTDLHFMITIKWQDGTIFKKIVLERKEYDERMSKYFELFSERPITEGQVIHKYDEYFLLSYMPDEQSGMRDLDAPPAIFLLDFENNNLYYVGYAKGWFEYELEHATFLNRYSMLYKLTKEG